MSKKIATVKTKVNKRKLRTVRDFIAKNLTNEDFNMSTVLEIDNQQETVAQALKHTCGTVGCIAGWSALILEPNKTKKVTSTDIFGVRIERREPMKLAREYLEMNKKDAHRLFMGYWLTLPEEDRGNLEYITKRQALVVLDRILNDKEWSADPNDCYSY